MSSLATSTSPRPRHRSLHVIRSVPIGLSTLTALKPVENPRKLGRPEEGRWDPLWARQEREQAEQTAETRRALLADLTGFGMPSGQAELLLDEREWLVLAFGIAYVREQVATGLVRSAAGLFCWWLKRRTGKALYR